MKIFRLLIPLFIIVSSACDKTEETTFFLNVYPSESIVEAETGDVVTFKINCTSEISLDKFTIKSNLKNTKSITLLDSSVTGKKKLLYKYEYLVPFYVEETNIYLTFEVFDIEGNYLQAVKKVSIKINDPYLIETSGHQMFSAASNEPDAYDIHHGLPKYSEVSDSSELDIVDVSEGDTLSRKWVSYTGLKFVKYNGFDYANSTKSQLVKSIESGIKLDFIDKLETNDIILIQLDKFQTDSSYAVIKITQILDSEGSVNDAYIFSIKK